MSETKPSSELLSAIESADTKALKDVATVLETNKQAFFYHWIIGGESGCQARHGHGQYEYLNATSRPRVPMPGQWSMVQ